MDKINSHLNKYIASWRVILKLNIHIPAKLTKKSLLLPNALRFESYLNDCRKYIFQFNRKNRRQHRVMGAWANVFIKVIHTTMKLYSVLNIKSLTREEIVALNLPCRNIY